jgi:hypothetical protein
MGLLCEVKPDLVPARVLGARDEHDRAGAAGAAARPGAAADIARLLESFPALSSHVPESILAKLT